MGLGRSLRVFCLAWVVACDHVSAVLAQSDGITTFVASLDESPKEIVDRFSFLSGELDFSAKDGVVYVSYAGLDAPREFTTFLSSKIPNLPTQSFGEGYAANFSVALIEDGDTTQMRLVMFEPSELATRENGLSLPGGTEVIFNDGFSDACEGQIVLAYNKPESTAKVEFPKWLAEQGFSVMDSSDESTSFFIGSQKSCTVFVYVQPDPDTQIHSLIVLRFLED